jgi:hypothetical protein
VSDGILKVAAVGVVWQANGQHWNELTQRSNAQLLVTDCDAIRDSCFFAG